MREQQIDVTEAGLAQAAAEVAALEAAWSLPAVDPAPVESGHTGPVPQGDVLFVPSALFRGSERWLPTALSPVEGGTVLVDGPNQHIVSGACSVGVPGKGAPRNAVAVVEVEPGGRAVVKHTGHHDDLVLAQGVWLVMRQTRPDTLRRVEPTEAQQRASDTFVVD